MLEFTLPLWGDALLFVASAALIGFAGRRSAHLADRFADRTGLGEALTGTIALGAITAVPGLLASVTAAVKGHASMAIANALGGIALQTAALAVADIAHRGTNLEHAAASVPNMMQASLLVLLIVLVMLGLSGPEVALPGEVHPVTVLLLVAAAFGFCLVVKSSRDPMWKPVQTAETVEDSPLESHQREHLGRLVALLGLTAGLTAVGGVLVAEAAENLVEETTIPEAVVGGVFMAAVTSLPELVTSVAAVRRGALTLAVGDVVGGNLFDVLFVAAADLVYLEGSLYHAAGVGRRELFLAALTVLLNVILLAGLIYRQKRGPGNIGFESVAMIVLYVGGLLVLSFCM